MDFIVNYYLGSGFIPAAKMNLGIPLYGHGWTLSSNVVTPPAPASGPSTPGTFTKQAGMLGYNEICYNILHRGWKSVNDPSGHMGPYAHSVVGSSRIQWVGYDSPEFAIVKSHYAMSKKLGGIVFWELSNDDFGNICGGGENTLIYITFLNI